MLYIISCKLDFVKHSQQCSAAIEVITMVHEPEYSYLGVLATGQVPRTELIKKVKRYSINKHIYITAASGYGKTVAALQWLSSVRGNTAKLIADSRDNVPGFYYKRFATAILKLVGKPGLVPDAAISFDRLLQIVKRLPVKGKRCYLVIDDIHAIKNDEIIKRMPFLFKAIPGYIRCCLINRTEPSAAFIDLNIFEIIDKDDLAFSTEEIEWLCLEKGIELRSEQIYQLRNKTGGWAMYLLAILSTGEFPDEIMSAKTPPSLTQYIESQIWEHLEQDIKELLLKLAIPDEINCDLCERLTRMPDGEAVLKRISAEENSFLSLTDTDKAIYRFHDIYREFLLSKLESFLPGNELKRLHDVTGKWYYEHGYYYEGARHFIFNKDHDGITKCLSESLQYLKETSHISVETRLNYTKQYIKDLSPGFISENIYLVIWTATAAYHDGDTKTFLKYIDIIYKRYPEIVSKYPNLISTVMFVCSLDFRVPILSRCSEIASKTATPVTGAGHASDVVRINSVTQNLPFFHRSMRDYSELHRLNAEDLDLVGKTYGTALGKDNKVLSSALTAGIYYERGEMLDAAWHALAGYKACTDDMHPETRFCSCMMLAAVWNALGAHQESSAVLDEINEYIENEARYLAINYKAVRIIWFLHKGDKDAAYEWLNINAYKSSGPLPFYQICRHYATLHSLIAVGDYSSAIDFGNRLYTLADEFRRPLDKIQSSLLLSIALRRSGEQRKSDEAFKHAVELAMPYGFIQLFVLEGEDILPMLWRLKDRKDTNEEIALFAETISDAIYKRYMIEPDEKTVPGLSKKQLLMLSYIDSGMTYNEISKKAGISRDTVKYHLVTAYKKLGVHDSRRAIIKAKEQRLL